VTIESSLNFSFLGFVAKIIPSFCGWPEYPFTGATASYHSPFAPDDVQFTFAHG
jgi:hypothetical protein